MSLTVFKVKFELAGKEIEGYSAHEVDQSGKIINYLSGQGIASLLNLEASTTLQKRLSKELKALLGEDFTTLQGKVLNTTGAYTKLNLWTTDAAAKFFLYHSWQGNKKAREIMLALAATTLDIIINDAFDREYKKGEAAERVKARLEGKIVRNEATRAIKKYLERHPEASDDKKRWVYINVSEAVNLGIFGRKSKKLQEDWNCDNPRDAMTAEELRFVQETESLTARLISIRDVAPMVAVKQALSNLCIPLVER